MSGVSVGGVTGCGSYSAYIVPRGGGPIFATVPWSKLAWARVLDDTSAASATSDKSDCNLVAGTLPWRHELSILRDGAQVWIGPVLSPSSPASTDHRQFQIDARDLSAWWDHRFIHNDYNYVAPTDLAQIFQDFATDAMQPDNSPGLHVVTTPCGITGVMQVLASQHQIAGSQLRDLANTGIDWTVINRDVLAGGATVPVADLGTFRDEHFINLPLVHTDGSVQTNLWIVRGSGGGAAGDTIYAASADAAASLLDGLLESVDTVSTIQDYVSAKAAADSRVAITKAVTGVENAVLAATAPFAVASLIPGATCRLELHDTGTPVSGRFRLQRVDCTVDAVTTGTPNEQISLIFQPIGTP